LCRGSTVGHLCIPRNQTLGHDKLMHDCFTEVPIYLSRLFLILFSLLLKEIIFFCVFLFRVLVVARVLVLVHLL
jgi:hypothetical protein